MKRIIFILMVLFLSAGLVYGLNYEVTKKAGDYIVPIMIDRNPPIVGNNNMMIWLKDATGKDVKGAIITVDYIKDNWLLMPTKKFNSWAQPHENNYHAILKIPERGSWDIIININHKGKSVSTEFRIDVK